MSSTTSQHLAIVVGPERSDYPVKSIDIPKHEANEILVKVHTTGQNPADWKFCQIGYVAAYDFAGVVVEVGSEVTKAKKGDRVAGFINGGWFRPGHGTYAQYARVDGRNFFRIPEGVSFDNAATYGIVWQTANLGLYYGMKLPEPYSTPDPDKTPILIWGGATANGNAAIQLAKLSGLTVITTASPKHNEYLKSLGADYVLPYSDPNTPAEIKKITKGKLYLGYDSVTEHGSTQLVIDSLGNLSDIPTGKKREVAIVLPVDHKDLSEDAKDVEFHLVLVYTLAGEETKLLGISTPGDPKKYEFSIRMYDILERLMTEKKTQHQRLKYMGGLEKVQEGFEYMKAGKVSAEKLIYHPWETQV